MSLINCWDERKKERIKVGNILWGRGDGLKKSLWSGYPELVRKLYLIPHTSATYGEIARNDFFNYERNCVHYYSRHLYLHNFFLLIRTRLFVNWRLQTVEMLFLFCSLKKSVDKKNILTFYNWKKVTSDRVKSTLLFKLIFKWNKSSHITGQHAINKQKNQIRVFFLCSTCQSRRAPL